MVTGSSHSCSTTRPALRFVSSVALAWRSPGRAGIDEIVETARPLRRERRPRTRARLQSSRRAGRPTGHHREPHGGDDEAGDARQLRDAEAVEPEAVEPERLDREAAHGVQTDIAEEQRARPVAKPRTEPEREGKEDPGVPERLVEEGGMKVVVLREPGRSMRR